VVEEKPPLHTDAVESKRVFPTLSASGASLSLCKRLQDIAQIEQIFVQQSCRVLHETKPMHVEVILMMSNLTIGQLAMLAISITSQALSPTFA
jgi:hypothetical protein